MRVGENRKYHFEFFYDLKKITNVELEYDLENKFRLRITAEKADGYAPKTFRIVITEKKLQNILKMFDANNISDLLQKEVKILYNTTTEYIIGIGKPSDCLEGEYIPTRLDKMYPFEEKTHLFCMDAYMDQYMNVYS